MDRKKSLIRDLNRFAKKISKEYSPERIILFGSQAKGKATKHSDVDLIIVSSKFKNKHKLDRSPNLYLKWNIDYPVDFLCYTPEEFERKKKQIGIVQQAVKEGIEII